MTTEMIIVSIICFCLGFVISALLKPKADAEFIRSEIWEVESGLRGSDPIDDYDLCLNRGDRVAEATNPDMCYYVFDIYSEGHTFIAESRNDLVEMIYKNIEAMGARKS